ncbi:nitroreductase family deazaflavin-dependent oxidoreductase [Nocardia sp. NPDC004582]
MSNSPTPATATRALPRALARFNRRVTNRIQGAWSPYLPPWAVILHTGRKSGNLYATPVLAFRQGDRIAIGLPYGPKTQWVANLLAAQGGRIRRAGKTLTIADPRVVDSREPHLPFGAKALGRLTDHVLIVRIAGNP